MLVSLSWLRALCPVDATAAELARALTDRGLTVDDVSNLFTLRRGSLPQSSSAAIIHRDLILRFTMPNPKFTDPGQSIR